MRVDLPTPFGPIMPIRHLPFTCALNPETRTFSGVQPKLTASSCIRMVPSGAGELHSGNLKNRGFSSMSRAAGTPYQPCTLCLNLRPLSRPKPCWSIFSSFFFLDRICFCFFGSPPLDLRSRLARCCVSMKPFSSALRLSSAASLLVWLSRFFSSCRRYSSYVPSKYANCFFRITMSSSVTALMNARSWLTSSTVPPNVSRLPKYCLSHSTPSTSRAFVGSSSRRTSGSMRRVPHKQHRIFQPPESSLVVLLKSSSVKPISRSLASARLSASHASI
mmetsp:Transcript_18149/g.52106  ORF Transcript_18149/g.52106 Transcript_18149/m.52106 type:complete len:276 (-) Transcript_18149:324-1151(-)